MKAKLYRIHRLVSLVVFIPIVFWCLSGILHPVMANWFRIKPAQRLFVPALHNTDTSRLTLKAVCEMNGLDSVQNVGITFLDDQEVYQLKQENTITYYNTASGQIIENGDEAYAEHLARYYTGDFESRISSIEKLTAYTSAYKAINRHLPVYKVSFDNAQQMDAYVHTETGALGTLNDKYRKIYLWCFSVFHNWSFLGSNQAVKSAAILLFSLLVFFNGCMGLYIYWVNRKAYKKQKKDNPKLKPRKHHRTFSLFTAIFLLAFAFSGGYHTFKKFDHVQLNDFEPQRYYSAEKLDFTLNQLMHENGPITRINLNSLNQTPYIRVCDTSAVTFYNLTNGERLENGDSLYAINRALTLANRPESDVFDVRLITQYERNYGFINKRLPVYEIQLNTPDHLTYYIEPSTGIPGAIHADGDKWEALSFSFLHKYHFLDFIGKGWRDLIMTLATLSLIVISITGLIIWLRLRRKGKA